jgi:hypothetical protein
VVIGNKLDASADREVQAREGKAWANAKGFQYFEASAKSGQNVAKAFDALIDTCQAESKSSPFDLPKQRRPSSPLPRQSTANATPAGHPSKPPSRESAYASEPLRRESSKEVGEERRDHSDPATWSVKELKRKLDGVNATYGDCLEKEDFVKRWREVQAKRQEFKEGQANEAREQREEKEKREAEERYDQENKDKAIREVEEWCRGKDIRAMLNALLQYETGSDRFLARNCDLVPVQKAYKKVSWWYMRL